MESIMSNLSYVMIAVAVICTLVSIITELTKEIGFLKKIPTAVQVTITSVALTIITLISASAYKNIQMKWYYIFAAFVAGIFIAFITMYGWEALIKRFRQFYKSDTKEMENNKRNGGNEDGNI